MGVSTTHRINLSMWILNVFIQWHILRLGRLWLFPLGTGSVNITCRLWGKKGNDRQRSVMLIVTTSSAHQRHKGLQSMKNRGFSHDVKAAILGNLSNNDGDGYENITWRRNSCCFKLYRAYSITFNSSIFSKFFWSWILKYCIEVQEKKKKVVVLCSRFVQNVKLGTFTL